MTLSLKSFIEKKKAYEIRCGNKSFLFLFSAQDKSYHFNNWNGRFISQEIVPYNEFKFCTDQATVTQPVEALAHKCCSSEHEAFFF